ncbi:unnamed protein product [Paramecium pentaurelia]|uniref:Uncharacterized protein n=1 Tax=Paramecium pentaurelia TaxID=43138 RepID=A0A8S1YHP8_9CILI|nr:unnamed protein product [Paramecium pentaurelia]
MICLYLFVKEFTDVVKREFSSVTYLKFKSYTSKFYDNLATQVFKYETVTIDPKAILQIKNQPFYEAVMWRKNVEKALNKIPQFFVYIFLLFTNEFNMMWFMSFIQQLKESVQPFSIDVKVLTKKNQSGGGSYDQIGESIKIEMWIELIDGFKKSNLRLQTGEYKNGKNVGTWVQMDLRKN